MVSLPKCICYGNNRLVKHTRKMINMKKRLNSIPLCSQDLKNSEWSSLHWEAVVLIKALFEGNLGIRINHILWKSWKHFLDLKVCVLKMWIVLWIWRYLMCGFSHWYNSKNMWSCLWDTNHPTVKCPHSFFNGRRGNILSDGEHVDKRVTAATLGHSCGYCTMRQHLATHRKVKAGEPTQWLRIFTL